MKKKGLREWGELDEHTKGHGIRAEAVQPSLTTCWLRAGILDITSFLLIY